ncbi:MAG: PfkB family carbohydrate kinase, partial [Flavobacteriales bacterium]|nr:PfkB family carbohydrate kinase [Flavobacteriales bacterium]
MKPPRIREILRGYERLQIAIVGDFCLDRYLDIDPTLSETSIETGLEVYNVTRVRTQAGAAGTILNNLVALGIQNIHVLGFCGTDGEGWLLKKALSRLPGVHTDHFIETPERQTFTYTKPLVVQENQAPRELNRLDQKNWTPTPESISKTLAASLRKLAKQVDAIIVMDQVDVAETGVITPYILDCLDKLQMEYPSLCMMADSRRGLEPYPWMTFKMNAAELAQWMNCGTPMTTEEVKERSKHLSQTTGHPVFVSMAEQGIVGAQPGSHAIHEPALPVH